MARESASNIFRIHLSLIDLDYVPSLVDQKRGRKSHVAMAVKQVTVEDVVNSGNFICAAKDWKC